VSLKVLDGELAICRLEAGQPLPGWFSLHGPFSAAVRRDGELSLVCDVAAVPAGVTADRGWRALELEGSQDLTLTGVLAGLARPLADAGVPLFALATYDTDVLLVPAARLADAVAALRAHGHTVLD
jgi:hypothetical protein